MNRICVGGIYRHFKGKDYQLVAIATHSETAEKMVVYQALYGEYGFYVRPFDMFFGKVDKRKYPNVAQDYRFELINDKSAINSNSIKIDNSELQNSINREIFNKGIINRSISSVGNNRTVNNENVNDTASVMESQNSGNEINPYLMQFLDANTIEERMDVLKLAKVKGKVTKDLLRNIAASYDMVINDKGIDEQYEELFSFLVMKQKYESVRKR